MDSPTIYYVRYHVHYITNRNEIAIFKVAFQENAIQMVEDLLALGYCAWISESYEDDPYDS